jgi:nucleotide-binding universal stress UspA family protein
MKGIREVLVPVDGSETSSTAVGFAIGLAKYVGAGIVFCHSVDTTGVISGSANPYGHLDVEPILEALEKQCAAYLRDAVARATAAGVRASAVQLAGSPVGAILAFLQDRPTGAIVMGTHGSTGISRFFLGSTAEGLVRRAGTPVFVVPPGAKTPCSDGSPFGSIEVAFDGSEAAKAALHMALDLAKPGATKLFVTHAVGPNPEEREAAEALADAAVFRARAAGIAAQALISEGAPARRVLELAQSHGAQLIAIGARGRRGIGRVLLGSVAEAVLRGAFVPVLVVPGASAKLRMDVAPRAAVSVLALEASA